MPELSPTNGVLTTGAVRLTADEARRRFDPLTLPFLSVTELADLAVPPGQEVAIEALQFGASIRHADYHIYAFAPTTETRQGFVHDFLAQRAATEPAPTDICYAHNFDNPQCPIALSLPAGRGAQLRDAMKNLVQELRATLPAAFENEDYRTRRQGIDERFKQKHEEPFEALQQRARTEGIAIIRTPMGIAFAPMRDGEVLPSPEFQALPEAERAKITATIEKLQEEMERILRQIPVWAREHRDEIRRLNGEIVRYAVAHIMDELRSSFADVPPVTSYLGAVEQDLIGNADDFLRTDVGRQEGELGPVGEATGADGMAFRRYGVNLLVDNGRMTGAPVIYEDNPTVHSLIGRIEHIARFGALLTDFNLLKAGALHRANGGYLVLDAAKLVRNPLAYEALKRALRAQEVRIQSLEQMLSLTGTISPDAQPVPLRVKVVLIGPRWLHHALAQIDSEFSELFKVQVDVEDQVDRSADHALMVARLIATNTRRHNLRPLTRDAVALVLEHLSRQCGDNQKFTVDTPEIVDLLKESDHWATQAARTAVDLPDVQRAIDSRQRRADRIYRRLREQVRNGVLKIETQGARIGQVNGLSVFTVGGFSFGHPSRITAQVRRGAGGVIDIEREVELGGRLHSKGVMILAGFLGGRYIQDRPLPLQASLVFEQSYGPVDGDSASSAELFALLSAIGQLPVRQDLAVTGSVDQLGNIQAIGGVNEKIEGFFDVCAEVGLTGHQGVIIPAANVRHLILRQDVVKAVRDDRFAIYAVRTVDDGIALLTGLPAGIPDAGGTYPAATANAAVAARLARFAKKASKPAQKRDGGSDDDER
ncbi:MAG: AAA family ATPase [Rhodospirillales bacterium]|nr:AAA family ATPase [Rhodospirillales bacterium]